MSSSGIERDVSPTLVNRVMVLRTQWDEVLQISWAAMFPRCDVMRFAMSELHRAVRIGACSVFGGQGPSLVDRGQSFGPPNIEWDAFTAQHDRNDVGVASEPSECFEGEFDAVLRDWQARFGDAIAEVGQVNVNQDLGTGGTNCFACRGRLLAHVEQGECPTMVVGLETRHDLDWRILIT